MDRRDVAFLLMQILRIAERLIEIRNYDMEIVLRTSKKEPFLLLHQ